MAAGTTGRSSPAGDLRRPHPHRRRQPRRPGRAPRRRPLAVDERSRSASTRTSPSPVAWPAVGRCGGRPLALRPALGPRPRPRRAAELAASWAATSPSSSPAATRWVRAAANSSRRSSPVAPSTGSSRSVTPACRPRGVCRVRPPARAAGADVPEPRAAAELMAALRSGDPAALGAALHNDLEPAAFSLRPAAARAPRRGGRVRRARRRRVGSGPTVAFLTESHEASLDLSVSLAASGLCRDLRGPRARSTARSSSPAPRDRRT